MKYRMVCTDLDGTFLNKRSEVTRENLEAVEKMAKAGIEFVPVTGRILGGIPPELMESEYIRYIICSNGACIYDKKTKQEIITPLDRATLDRILDTVSEYSHISSVHYGSRERIDATKYAECDKYNVNKVYQLYYSYVADFNENFSEWIRTVDGGVKMFTAFFEREADKLECKARLSSIDSVHVTSSFPENIEFFNKDATKGCAITRLTDMLGISLDEVIAVGDSENDLSMLEVAGLALAVENATDEVKKSSDEIICSNADNTAKYVWEHFV